MSNIKTQINNSSFENTSFFYDNKEIYKLLGNIPIHPDIFLGRNNDVKEIRKKLTNYNFLLFVNGTGGIGKTTLVTKYYFKYLNFYSHLIWIVPKKGIKEAIISLASSLKLEININNDENQQIIEVLRCISSLNKPILLIIDNANNLDDLNENFKILRQFQNTHIIVTTRIENFQHVETYKINPLDKISANDLFKYYFKSFKIEEQDILDKILIAIEYNTLVIELLAKNLNEFNNGLNENYPIQKLLEDIQQKGLLNISKTTVVESDYILLNAKPEEIIRTMYDISNITIDEKEILSIFAFLPSISITFQDLEFLLPKVKELDRKLLNLSTKGWIDFDKESKSFKVHPIVSEISRENVKHLVKFSKRIFDIIFSTMVIVSIFSWFVPLVSFLIKIESNGPIFIMQKRIGLKGKVFEILKFRTMGAPKEIDSLLKSLNEPDDPTIKFQNKSRITKLGSFLIKTNLDSFPQFINVLFGDLSVVGPMPYLSFQNETTESLNKFVRGYAKPGMTTLSLARGHLRVIETYEDMLLRIKDDIYYIENWSILLDFKIILKTIFGRV
jgi:lipopolysaccharide/colanic/teichoic acid biosynthesis glycosyltransferase